MKFVLLLAACVAHVASQGDGQDHFQIRGQNQNQRQSSQGTFPQSSSNRFGNQNQGQANFGSRTRSSSRFANSQRAQELRNQQSSSAQNHFNVGAQRTRNDGVRAIQNNAQAQQSVRPVQRTTNQVTSAQQQTRSQPAKAAPAKKEEKKDSGRLLSLPEPELCANRPKQWKHGDHYYYFSWDQETEIDPKTGKIAQPKVDWLKARNECRKRCMDSIGIESEAENEMVVKFLTQKKLKYIWTSGRLCDFKGCETRRDLHPLPVLGWFWSNTNTKTAPTNSTPPGWKEQPWSPTGHTGVPQPDNAEFDINKTPESCLGVLNDIYKDGIRWHDIACYHKKPFICEDSDLLLNYVRSQNPGIIL